MNKILFIAIALLISTFSFAQSDSTSNVSFYGATGLSMTNTTDFRGSSYPSIEFGVMVDNISIAGVFGRNNLSDFNNGLGFDNYWYEGKVAYSFPLGSVSGYGLFGLGTYIGAEGSLFIEYGGGITKEFGNTGISIQVSSWDGIVYLTPCLSRSF